MSSSSKLFTIFSHEYTSKVKSKGFILGTFIAPLAFILIIGVSAAATILSQDSTERKLAVIDETDFIGTRLVESDTSKYFLTNKSESELKSEISAGTSDGYVVIPKDILEVGEVEVFSPGGGGIGFTSSLENNLKDILREARLDEYGASEELRAVLNKSVNLKTQKITDEGKVVEDKTSILSWIGYMLGFVIYFLMFIYGGMISRSVIEEKSNRIVEIIASSAKPFDILLGKVLAVGSLGLTQIFTWLILIGGISIFLGPILAMFVDIDPTQMQAGMTVDSATQEKVNEIMSNFPEISPMLIFGFVFYFLSGYFIYSTIFAALGSAVDNEQDAAQLQTPISIFIIIPILLVQAVMTNPDAWWAIALSHFPFFTPMLMIVRISATNVPIIEIIISVIIMISSFLGALWVSAKIYRIGILMTGKKPKFKDLIKWMKAS